MTWAPEAFGEAWASVYDDVVVAQEPGTDAAIAWLAAALPPGGRVLDLGVGTGRLAIPLADRGHAVTGVDASPAMLAALAAKPGGSSVTGVQGDLTAPPVDGPFDLVLLAGNTLFVLPSAAAQLRCVAAAAALLALDGLLVVEADVPQPWQLGPHDAVEQVVRTVQRVGGADLPVDLRYAWPGEVDLMADRAGLARRSRRAGWDDATFDGGSTRHVSVYAHRGTERRGPTDEA